MATWFVRPAGSHSNANDGTSYDTAWEGCNTIVWGTGGVVAGDTLYVCDHWADYSVSLTANRLTVSASGTSESPITIRGDYPGHLGTMFGGYIKSAAGTGAWTPLESGVYRHASTAGTVYRWTQNKSPINFVPAGTYSTPPSSAEMSAMPEGSSYRDGSGYRYVKLAGLADPDDYDMALVAPDSMLVIGSYSYINVTNLNLLCAQMFVRFADDCTIDGCNITSADTGIAIGTLADSGDCERLVIKNCTIDYCAEGIYSYYGATGMTVQNCTITNCVDEDEDYRVIGSGIDNHAIGIMGFPNHLIEYCTFRNAGTGVTLYDGHSSNPGVTIRNCWAEDIYRPPSCTTNGILDCHGAAYDVHLSGGVNPGNVVFKVHNCVAINCDNSGIRSLDNPYAGNTSTFELFNNTIIGCQIGIAPHNSTAAVGAQKIANNLIYEPTDRSNGLNCSFIDWDYDAAIDCDHNAFYSSNAGWPSTAALFFQRTGYLAGNQWTLAQWRASTYTPDANSVTGDPLFTNAANDDFTLQSGSPCIDAGTNTGLSIDYAGTARPLGAGFDIGAFEFSTGTGAQIARPESDVSSTGWATTPPGQDLFSVMDEEAASSADYAFTMLPSQTMEVLLSAVSDPLQSTGHVVSWKGYGSYTLSLRQGSSTEIAAWTKSDATETPHAESLTGTQADSITDYTDLRIRVVSSA